jgi:hypothetical protein
MKIKEKINNCYVNLINKVKNFEIKTFWSKLSRSQKYYFSGLMLVVLGTIPIYVSSYYVVLIMGLTLLACGIISDFLFLTHKILQTLLGKGALIIVSSLITTMGYAFAGQIINEIVQFDISGINYATSFAAILLIPLLLLIIPLATFLFLFFIFIISAPFFFIKDILEKMGFNFGVSEHLPTITMVLRVFIYATFFGIIQSFFSNHAVQKPYEEFVIGYTKAFIYNFEAKKYSRCANIPENAKVITVPENNDEIILVAKVDKNYTFNAIQCVPKLVKTK